MAFSKGKRIEDETSKRIIDLSVNIGCKEGPDALTVTRLCKELNCDRRVVYNRFRDIDELSMIVSDRCCQELIENVKVSVNQKEFSFDGFICFIEKIFEYIYKKGAYFQYYTSLYKVEGNRIKNCILQELVVHINDYKRNGLLMENADIEASSQVIWLMIAGSGNILVNNVNLKYNETLKTVLTGSKAVFKSIYRECDK